MGSPEESNPTPRELLRAVFRHGQRMLLIFVAVSALTVLGAIVWPRSYESEAKLLVRLGRESVSLDPTATTGQTIAFQKFQEEEVNSILDILNSRKIKEAIVDRVGADAILHGTSIATGDNSASENALREMATAAKSALGSFVDVVATGIGIKDPISERERAIRQLAKKYVASAPKKSTVATIECRAKSPQLAQAMVAAAVDAFLEQHVRMSRTAGSHAFFSEQATLLKTQLEDAYRILRDRKNEYGLINVESKRGILHSEMSDVELAMLAVERDLRYSETMLERLLASMNELPTEVISETVNVSNTARDGMRQQLYELETREQELLAKRTADHPSVRKIQSQREKIERILQNQPADRENSTAVPNPIRKGIEGDVLRERANVKALASRRGMLTEQQETLRKQLRQLNEQEVEIDILERKTELLEANYRVHVEKLEQARIDDALDEQRISSINVAQPATFVEKAASPNKKAVLLAGLMLAILSSAGYAVAAETLDSTLRAPEQVEAELGLPVLASVPHAGSGFLTRTLHGAKKARIEFDQPSEQQPCYEALAGRIGGSTSTLLDSKPGAIRVGIVHATGDVHDGTVATQLAMHARQLSSQPVLLVDADMAHHAVGDQFGVNGAPGLWQILQGESDVDTCLMDAGVANLSLLAAGAGGRCALSLREMTRIPKQLEGVSQQYGVVIVDLPVPSPSGAEIAIAAEMDAVLLVVEAEATRIHAARRIKQQLSAAGANVLGVVLNGRKHHIPEWLYRRI